MGGPGDHFTSRAALLHCDGNTAKNGPHHLSIINNICHDSAGSGISIYEPRAVAGAETMRIFVLRNTSFANTALVLPNDVAHFDGNGIIMDDFRNTQKPNPAGVYPYRSLVENNVCYMNGGKGIHVFISDNVTVRNNTCYFNDRDPKNPATWRGELRNVQSSNTIWVNNIGYADVKVNRYNRGILHAGTSTKPRNNVVWKRNLSFNGTAGSASIPQSPRNVTLTSAAPYLNLLGVNPLFVAAGQGITSPDLDLQPTSKACNAAVLDYGVGTIDRDGNPRVSGTAPDLGAYETIA